MEMNPFMSANKIKKPILLIHLEDDNNPQTLSMPVRVEPFSPFFPVFPFFLCSGYPPLNFVFACPAGKSFFPCSERPWCSLSPSDSSI
jgi:hypothetical protein